MRRDHQVHTSSQHVLPDPHLLLPVSSQTVPWNRIQPESRPSNDTPGPDDQPSFSRAQRNSKPQPTSLHVLFSVEWKDSGGPLTVGSAGVSNCCQAAPRLYVAYCFLERVRMKA